MRGTPPFTDAEHPEVCARVAVALVRLAYYRNPGHSTQPVPYIRAALNALPRDGFPIVVTALLGLQYALLNQRLKSADWLRQACVGSRMGYGFRRCYFNDYKANRRGKSKAGGR